MNQNRTLLNIVTLIIFMAIVGFILVAILTTFHVTNSGSLRSALSSTPNMTRSTTPGQDGTQTLVAIVTLKAIDEATFLAITRTPETPIYLPTGIYDDQRVRISAALLFIDAQNAWGGFIDGYRFTLYAGVLQSDLDQGVVGLVINSPDGKRFAQFVTPTKHGALHIVSEQSNRFTLVATDGMVFYFDLPTRQFVASLTEVAPSVTPSPLPTPSPTSLPYPPPITSETPIP